MHEVEFGEDASEDRKGGDGGGRGNLCRRELLAVDLDRAKKAATVRGVELTCKDHKVGEFDLLVNEFVVQADRERAAQPEGDGHARERN